MPPQTAMPPPPQPSEKDAVTNTVIAISPQGNKYIFDAGTTPEEMQAKFKELEPETVVSSSTPTQNAKSFARTLAAEGLNTIRRGLPNLLPTAGGIAGAVAGAPAGPAGAIGGATLGGAAGEAGKQLLNRASGENPVPETSGEAAKDIAMAGGEQGAMEGIGQGAAKALKPVYNYLSKTAARSSRVPLLPSEAGVASPFMSKVEGFAEHALPSMGTFQKFRENQLQRAYQAIDEEIGRIGTGQATATGNLAGSAEDVGLQTRKALETTRAALKDSIDSVYKGLDALTESKLKHITYTEEVPSSIIGPDGQPLMTVVERTRPEYAGAVMPETAGLKKLAANLKAQLDKEELLTPSRDLAEARSQIDAILASPDKVPFETMGATRSNMLAMTRKLDEVIPGKRAGLNKLFTKEIDRAMEEAATKAGVDAQWRDANDMVRTMHEKFERTLVDKIMTTDKPEAMTEYIKQSAVQDLRDLNSLLDPTAKQKMQAQVVRDVLHDKAGEMRSPRDFAAKFNELGEARAKELFGQNYAPLKNLANTLERVGSRPGAGNIMSSMHNWTYIKALPWAGVLAGTGHPLAAAGVLASPGVETIFMRKLANAMTNPAKVAGTVARVQKVLHASPYAVDGAARALYAYVSMEDSPLGTEGAPLPGVQRPALPRELQAQPGSAMPPPPAR